MTTEETTKAPGHVGAESGERKADPNAPRLWLTGPARHAATIACVLISIASLIFLLNGLKAPSMIDTTVRLRAAGGAVPIYGESAGGTAIHQMKPGSTVHLSSSKPVGTRYPAHVDIDQGERHGFVEEADFDGDDLGRMKAILVSKGF